MATKKNLYELLEVNQNASLDEIKASHLRLSRQIMSPQSGLTRQEIEFELKVLDMALQTLSDQYSRDSYDASIATPQLPPQVMNPPSTALTVNKAALDSIVLVRQPEPDLSIPIHVAEQSLSTTVSSFKKILRVVLIVIVGIFIINVFTFSLTGGIKNAPPSDAMSKAEEKVLLQEYYQTYGVRPANIEELRLLEADRRREEREARTAEYEANKKERDYQRFVEESRRMAEDASRNIQRAEERAKWEAERKALREREMLEMAERRRVQQNLLDAEIARRKLSAGSGYREDAYRTQQNLLEAEMARQRMVNSYRDEYER